MPPPLFAPPANSTRPLGSSVAVCPKQLVFMDAVKDQEFKTGLYSSALERKVRPVVSPPATRMVPLGSKVALGERREALMVAIVVQVPAVGSNNSAVAR